MTFIAGRDADVSRSRGKPAAGTIDFCLKSLARRGLWSKGHYLARTPEPLPSVIPAHTLTQSVIGLELNCLFN